MIDPTRHRDVFSPDMFGDRRVDVIGAGATGSRIALGLAKLGVQNLHVWDFDKVEEHNVANQLYPVGSVGKFKVTALAKLVQQQTGDRITVHREPATGNSRLGQVVFMLTDTMSSRKDIFTGALSGRFSSKLMIETRMGVDEGRVYVVRPWNPIESQRWLKTLYSDEDASVQASTCGSAITVGPTADLIAGFALWQFIKWATVEIKGEPEALDFEMIFGGREPVAMVF